MSVSIKIEMDETQIRMMNAALAKFQFGVVDKAVKAMTKPIIEKAKAIGPNSRRSGTRKKWGKKTTPKFNPGVWARDESSKHIASKILRTSRGAWIVVGGSYPRANKLNFNSNHDKGRKEVLWGRVSGRMWKAPDDFMKRAYDETKSSQMSSFNTALAEALREAGLG